MAGRYSPCLIALTSTMAKPGQHARTRPRNCRRSSDSPRRGTGRDRGFAPREEVASAAAPGLSTGALEAATRQQGQLSSECVRPLCVRTTVGEGSCWPAPGVQATTKRGRMGKQRRISESQSVSCTLRLPTLEEVPRASSRCNRRTALKGHPPRCHAWQRGVFPQVLNQKRLSKQKTPRCHVATYFKVGNEERNRSALQGQAQQDERRTIPLVPSVFPSPKRAGRTR
jgi:hypothetical protein